MDNQQIQPSQNKQAEQYTLPQELPLDPAVERVRKKLMRLMIVSIAITLILMLAVLFGVVYKIIATGSSAKQTALLSSHHKNKETLHHTLSLPKNTQILSQSLSEHNISLKILTPDGQTKFMIYNYHNGALIAVLSVDTAEETLNTPPH
ncbi:hypothetical protein [Bartonella pachyuromydis]|uniref:Uncharacterized protein n=1 Tax=Bartonella pachyuromydis TaxID=931097 RepID=A0ABP8VKZ5_9HYPH